MNSKEITVGTNVDIISGYLKGKRGLVSEDRGSYNEIREIDGKKVVVNTKKFLVQIVETDRSTNKPTTFHYEVDSCNLKRTD